MARGRKHHRRGRRGYKKCLISKLRATKIKTPKQAARAFRMARKKCRVLLVKKPRRYGRKKRRYGRKRRGRRYGRRRRRFPRMSWQERRQIGVLPGEFAAMAGRIPSRFR